MQTLTINEGKDLVKAARATIELFLKNPNFNKELILDSLKEKGLDKMYGLFVVLSHYPTNELRGYAGYSKPLGKLKEYVIDAALASAFTGSRFVPVSHKELNDLLIEVNILSDKIRMHGDWRRRQKSIDIGKDGIMVEYGMYKALLLANVAVKQGLSPAEFLEEVCIKANIPKEYWKQPKVKIYKFETQIFKEKTPNGEIIEVDLSEMGS